MQRPFIEGMLSPAFQLSELMETAVEVVVGRRDSLMCVHGLLLQMQLHSFTRMYVSTTFVAWFRMDHSPALGQRPGIVGTHDLRLFQPSHLIYCLGPLLLKTNQNISLISHTSLGARAIAINHLCN